MKKMLNFRKVVILFVFVFVSLSFSKTKVKIDGNINIWIENSSRSKPTKSVGNMDDNQFIEKPFLINNRGYVFLNDQYDNKLLLRVIFDRAGNVIREDLYQTYRFTQNCISVKGDDNYCFTITSDGYPSIWDRYKSKYIYSGKFLNNVKINNPFKRRYDTYFDDIFD